MVLPTSKAVLMTLGAEGHGGPSARPGRVRPGEPGQHPGTPLMHPPLQGSADSIPIRTHGDLIPVKVGINSLRLKGRNNKALGGMFGGSVDSLLKLFVVLI